MRIALFVHCFFPDHFYGTETYTLDLARNLIDAGHSVTVVSAIFPGEPPASEPITRYTFQGVPVIAIDKNVLPNTRVLDTYYQPDMAPVLEAILTELRPDIVHVTHLINHTAVLLEVCERLKLPTVATLTDFFGFCYNNKLEAVNGTLCRGPNPARTNCVACHLKAFAEQSGGGGKAVWYGRPAWAHLAARALRVSKRFPRLGKHVLVQSATDIIRRPDILRDLYRHFRALIVPTAFLRDAYIENGFTNSMRLIHFGVDIDRTPKPPRSTEAPLRLGYIGQVSPHKGVHLLVEAVRRLPGGSVCLDIHGPEDQDAAYMARLRAMAEGQPIDFRGTFPKERMRDIFSDLDALVIPSTWYENSPLVLLSALATHTPPIISNVEGMTAFVKHGHNGLHFRRGDERALEGTLRWLITEPARIDSLISAANYNRSTAVMARDVVAVYESVL